MDVEVAVKGVKVRGKKVVSCVDFRHATTDKSQISYQDEQVELAYRYMNKKRINWKKRRLQNSQWFQDTSLCSGRKLGYARYVFSRLVPENENNAHQKPALPHALLQRTILVCSLGLLQR